jgi:3-oxoacyl-[acyl-carrier-protein] synthase-1
VRGRLASVALTGHHVVSAVGLDSAHSCAAIRAGIVRSREHAGYDPLPADPETPTAEPLVAAPTPLLDPADEGPVRFLELGSACLRGTLERVGLSRAGLARTALLVGLPAPAPVLDAWGLDQLVDGLLERTGLEAIGPRVVDRSGHTAVLALLEQAFVLLERGEADGCLVLAIDSYLDRGRLRALDELFRLKSGRGIDGFVPGEAAVGLFIEPLPARGAAGRDVLLRLGRPGFGREAQPSTSERASSGVGLTDAVRAATRSLSAHRAVRWVLCDLNGESYRAFEWGVVRVRMAERLGEVEALRHPADCLGDVGAAVGGLLVSCAAEAFARGYADDDLALLWAASDDDRRAAVVVSGERAR